MKVQIDASIEELKRLKTFGAYSLDRINWWLLKHQDIYDRIKNSWSCKICPTELGLPCFCKNQQIEYSFIMLFEALDLTYLSHQKEDYYKEQINQYSDKSSSGRILRNWLLHHPELEESIFYAGKGFIVCSDLNFVEVTIPQNLPFRVVLDADKYFKNNIQFDNLFSAYVHYKENYNKLEILGENDDKVLEDIKKSQLPLRSFFIN